MVQQQVTTQFTHNNYNNMNDLITISASLTYPLSELEKFADNRGYQTVVTNKDYLPASGSETIEDITAEKVPVVGMPDVMVYPQIPNPDYIAEFGTPTIPNPQTRIEFVKEWFKGQAVTLFAIDFKRDAQVQAQTLAKQIEDGAKAALAQAITIE